MNLYDLIEKYNGRVIIVRRKEWPSGICYIVNLVCGTDFYGDVYFPNDKPQFKRLIPGAVLSGWEVLYVFENCRIYDKL